MAQTLCLVPKSHGVSYNFLKGVDLWEIYNTLMPRVRKKIQESKETIAELAARLSLNPKKSIQQSNLIVKKLHFGFKFG